MIDKIELRLPPSIDFTHLVRSLLRQRGRAHPGLHYAGVLDLRSVGLPALLHYRKRRGEESHKLEFLETGKMPYSELCAVIESVVVADTSRLEIMRVDLCADIPNVPVSWFHDYCRFRYKRSHRQIGAVKREVIAGVEIETLIFGSRPNPTRAYNKREHWHKQFLKDCRKQSKDADSLDFEQEYGISVDAVLTRVERQYGGGRLPPELPDFGSIAAAVEIDPFAALEILPGNAVPPNIKDFEFGEWLKGMQLREQAMRLGAHNFRRWLNHYSQGNGARTLRRYAAFMPWADSQSLTQADILRMYRESTIRQLGG
jgi:hypothetical protein